MIDLVFSSYLDSPRNTQYSDRYPASETSAHGGQSPRKGAPPAIGGYAKNTPRGGGRPQDRSPGQPPAVREPSRDPPRNPPQREHSRDPPREQDRGRSCDCHVGVIM